MCIIPNLFRAGVILQRAEVVIPGVSCVYVYLASASSSFRFSKMLGKSDSQTIRGLFVRQMVDERKTRTLFEDQGVSIIEFPRHIAYTFVIQKGPERTLKKAANFLEGRREVDAGLVVSPLLNDGSDAALIRHFEDFSKIGVGLLLDLWRGFVDCVEDRLYVDLAQFIPGNICDDVMLRQVLPKQFVGCTTQEILGEILPGHRRDLRFVILAV